MGAAAMKWIKLLANLGYGSRKEIKQLFREGRICDAEGMPVTADAPLDPACLRLDGAPLDPLPGVLIALHKPCGYTCSMRDRGPLVLDLFPPRFRLRRPVLSTVGRLDRETSGLLLLTDDGALLHRIIAPRAQVLKQYEVTLAEDLRGHEAELFASGQLLLASETTPLAPARLEVLGPRRARLSLSEGRYHQVRRMFAATGNAVTGLQRIAIGQLRLEQLALASGQWRVLDADERARVLAS